MNLKKGDTFDITYTVEKTEVGVAYLSRLGMPGHVFIPSAQIEAAAKNIVHAKVEPAVGQVWRWKSQPRFEYLIIFVDEKTVLIETISTGVRSNRSPKQHKIDMEYVSG